MMHRNARIMVAVMVIAGVLLGGSAVAAQDTGSPLPTPVLVTPTPTPLPALNVATGEQVPAFTAVAVDYSLLSQDDLAGQPVALVFFASWCPHCQAEAPRIVAAAAAHPSVRIVMLSVADRETPQMVFDFAARFGLPFPTYWDGGKAAHAVGVRAYPTIIVADRSGTVQTVTEGEIPPEQVDALFAQVA